MKTTGEFSQISIQIFLGYMEVGSPKPGLQPANDLVDLW